MKNSDVGDIYDFIFENGPRISKKRYLFVLERLLHLEKASLLITYWHFVTFIMTALIATLQIYFSNMICGYRARFLQYR